MKLLNPWFVATGRELRATCPIGARELKRTDPGGSTSALQLANPNGVIVRTVLSKYGPDNSLRSFGVTQAMSPSQNAGFDVAGEAPLTIRAQESSRTAFHFT